MQTLELKVPPPVVALLVALAMWWVSRGAAVTATAEAVRLPLALALAALGIAFDLLGVLAFRKAKTTINPLKPHSSSAMVSSGIYRRSRNPMYVGMTLFLCGWAAYLWTVWAMFGPLAFVAYINRFQIVPEERALTRLFGAEYLAYQSRVRRWL